jgi:osmoprotectant transport system substrate-binding protein
LTQTLSSWDVQVLPAAPGEDQNGLVVTQALAQRFGLRTVSDLASIAPRLTLGAPTECPARPFCLVGFQTVYGLHFARFDAFDAESQRITALDQQVVDVALMNTTDGVLATGRFVSLGDDRSLQPAENVAPIVSARAIGAYGGRLVSALDDVSARLTTRELTFLNWRVGVAGNDVASEARGWLQRQGLAPRS